MSQRTLSYILAGGKGTRLMPLTLHRAKPAVGMGPSNRIIDYSASNLINSGFRRIIVLTQYQNNSVNLHVENHLSKYVGGIDQFIRAISPHEDAKGLNPFSGTAGAIEKSLRYIDDDTSLVNILAGDHVYFMDFQKKHTFHNDKKSEFTISAIPIKVEHAANKYGVLKVDEQGRVLEFQEKPENPAEIPGKPGICLASMGIYTANAKILSGFLKKDAPKDTPFYFDKLEKKNKVDKKKISEDPKNFSSHDFGYDIIPALLKSGIDVFCYNFMDNRIDYRERFSDRVKEMPEEQIGYWKDVGGIDEFFEANMELVNINPKINIYNEEWPLLGVRNSTQPSKDVDNQVLFGDGVIWKGCDLNRCILGDGSSVESSKIVNSILLGHNFIENGCHIEDTIMDKGIHVPAGTYISPNSLLAKEYDQKGAWKISDGKVIIPKGFKF